MKPRSLLVPPGVPDFFTRHRSVPAGKVTLTGKAWSGHGAIVAVEVSTDGGKTWDDASLDEAPDVTGVWRGWQFHWDAAPGTC